MPKASEGAANRKSGSLAADLAAGVSAISSNATIRFTKYIKLVLPLDGYVFWVRADLVSPSAVYGTSNLNVVAIDEPPPAEAPASRFDAPGSFHYATDNKQQADSSYAVNRVVFTSLKAINDLNAVSPEVMYIGEFDGLRFAFSSRKSFFRQADLYHYVGDAVYPVMKTQLIDSIADFDGRQVVSNSVPIWLSMNTRTQPEWEPFGLPLPLRPAYLVPDDSAPPFGTVDVLSTEGLASAPSLGKRYSHEQLVKDRVRVTLWGLGNDDAMTFVDYVDQFSINTELMGLMNVPVPREERVTQVELGVIAKKKVIEYEVNYLQAAARNLARQVIISAIPTYNFN